MTQQQNSTYHSITREYKITEDYLMKNTQQIDLSLVLQSLIETSSEHDKVLKPIITQHGDYLFSEDDIWVITQYNILVHENLELGDTITIRTRVLDANRFFVTRYFDVFKGDTLLLEVFVQFAGINLEKRNIVRLNVNSLLKADIIDTSLTASFTRIKIPEKYDAHYVNSHEIVAEDIDYNHHVNNGAYLRWCYNELPEAFLRDKKAKHVEVKYGKEILPEHEVEIETYISSLAEGDYNQRSVHIINNMTNEKEACRVSIDWEHNYN